MDIKKSIIGCDTLSLKDINEDAVVAKYVEKFDCNVIAVADGLGSFQKSDLASKFVCENLVDIIERDGIKALSLDKVFEEITSNLKEHSKKVIENEDQQLESFMGTTLICCIETIEEFLIGYVGNGGIFHLRGDFNIFPKRYHLPWNSINMLNPHSVVHKGKNALYKLISPNSTPPQFTPTILKLKKDTLYSGDIIMLCSDGIYSYDEVLIGKDAGGEIWISGEGSMELFYTHLRRFFSNEEWNNENLQACIGDYLNALGDENLIDDDISVAIIVSDRVIKHQQDLKKVSQVDE